MEKWAMFDVERIYANNGQHVEYSFRVNFTGERRYADNVSATVRGDVMDIQVKSARATACKGTDIRAHVAQDKAKRYAYVTKDFHTAYIMTPTEWIEMVETFGTLDHDSTERRERISTRTKGGRGGSNGGGEKIRLKSESRAMIEWLNARV